MLFMKVEMFSTQKSAMPLSFSNFDFLPNNKADSAGSRAYPFGHVIKMVKVNPVSSFEQLW